MKTKPIALALSVTLSMLSPLFAADAPAPQRAARAAGAPNRQAGGAQWIWAPGKPGDDQTLYVRKTFDLPEDPEIVKGMTATFWGSCDNVLAVTINGQSLGFSTEWQQPMSHHISQIIKPGKTLIAIRAVNQGGSAGLVARVIVNGPATKRTIITTDDTWKIADV